MCSSSLGSLKRLNEQIRLLLMSVVVSQLGKSTASNCLEVYLSLDSILNGKTPLDWLQY